MSKIQVNAAGIKHLADAARMNGTQDRFIDLAVEWCDGAEEIARGYKARIEKYEQAFKELDDLTYSFDGREKMQEIRARAESSE